MSSIGSGWIFIKIDYFLIKNQLKNELYRLRLDLYQIRRGQHGLKACRGLATEHQSPPHAFKSQIPSNPKSQGKGLPSPYPLPF